MVLGWGWQVCNLSRRLPWVPVSLLRAVGWCGCIGVCVTQVAVAVLGGVQLFEQQLQASHLGGHSPGQVNVSCSGFLAFAPRFVVVATIMKGSQPKLDVGYSPRTAPAM